MRMKSVFAATSHGSTLQVYHRMKMEAAP